jgi:hypothetical protein
MSVNIVFANTPNQLATSVTTLNENKHVDIQAAKKTITYQVSRQIKDIFTVDPNAPSLIFSASDKRKTLIFKSSALLTAKFKIIAFDRSMGFPASFGADYASIQNELFGEILPGGSMTLDGDLVSSDIYAFSSIDNSPLNITITEYR